MRPPASTCSHSRFQNGVYPPHTTQSRLGKLLRLLLHTKDIKDTPQHWIFGGGGEGKQFFSFMQKIVRLCRIWFAQRNPFCSSKP